jgi:hypothetical protein
MSEGVGVDMGTPDATPISSEGVILPKRVRFTVEVDKAGALKAARGFSAMGEQGIADRICQTAGIPVVRANVFEKFPKITGGAIALVAVGATWGGIKLYTRWRNKRAMPAVTADGKIIPLPIRATK